MVVYARGRRERPYRPAGDRHRKDVRYRISISSAECDGFTSIAEGDRIFGTLMILRGQTRAGSKLTDIGTVRVG